MKYALFFFCALLTACNDNNTNATADDTTKSTMAATDTATIATPTTNTTCYAYESVNDTVTLWLTGADQNISGNLMYAYSGKDKNSGTISGTMKGDTLLADYTFMSEGKSSVRQVAFLKKGDGLVEGYGEVEMEGGKMVFKNTGALKFDTTFKLQKIQCTL